MLRHGWPAAPEREKVMSVASFSGRSAGRCEIAMIHVCRGASGFGLEARAICLHRWRGSFHATAGADSQALTCSCPRRAVAARPNMPDLLLELRSEEIPARMQRKAAGDLKKMVTDGLVEAGLTYEARARILDAAPPDARHSRPDRALEGRARGAQGPEHQGAGAGDPGLSARGRPGLDRRGACPHRPEEGRFLRRPHRRSRAGRRKRSSPN